MIAACLQDARSSLREMVFSPDERRFVAAFTRYRRERMPDWSSCEGLTECLTALVFDEIDEVKYRGLDAGAARQGAGAADDRDRARQGPPDPHRPRVRGRRADPAAHRPHRLPARRFRRAGTVQGDALRPSGRGLDRDRARVIARLDEQEPGFAAGFAALVDAPARGGGRRPRHRRRASSPPCAGTATRRCLALTQRFDRLRLAPPRLRVLAGEIARGARRSAATRPSQPWSWRPSGSVPSTPASCRRTTAMSMRGASGWACAGVRSRRSASTCPAAPRPIRARC